MYHPFQVETYCLKWSTLAQIGGGRYPGLQSEAQRSRHIFDEGHRLDDDGPREVSVPQVGSNRRCLYSSARITRALDGCEGASDPNRTSCQAPGTTPTYSDLKRHPPPPRGDGGDAGPKNCDKKNNILKLFPIRFQPLA